MVVEIFAQLLGKACFIQQIGHPDRAARHLVFIGRADALAGSADLGGATRSFARAIKRGMVRQDDRTGFRHFQPRGDFDANRLQLVDLAQQIRHRQHHAIADIAGHAGAHNARRNQLQGGLLAADDERVSGIVAALKAHHALRVIGQPVNDLALALIAPLGADNYHVLCHNLL